MRWTRKIKTAMPVEQNGHFFTTRHTIFSPYFNRATAVLRNVIWNFIFSPTTVLCYLTRRLTRYLCSSTPPVIVVAENITVIFQLNDWNKYTYIHTYIHTYSMYMYSLTHLMALNSGTEVSLSMVMVSLQEWGLYGVCPTSRAMASRYLYHTHMHTHYTYMKYSNKLTSETMYIITMKFPTKEKRYLLIFTGILWNNTKFWNVSFTLGIENMTTCINNRRTHMQHANIHTHIHCYAS